MKLEERKFKKFKIGDIFDVSLWVYGKNKSWETRFDTYVDGSKPVLSGATSNNCVTYYTLDSYNEDEIFSDSLTITTRGNYAGYVAYHDYEFLLANNILVMPMPGLTKYQKLFISGAIKSLNYGGYYKYPTIEKLRNDEISLPVNESGEIDFDFMEDYIKMAMMKSNEQFKDSQNSYVEQYEKTLNKLIECNRTNINMSLNLKDREFKKFKIGDLFYKVKTNTLKYNMRDLPKEKQEGFDLPATSSGTYNNGLTVYVPREGATVINMALSITADGDAGRVFFQEDDFTILQSSYAIKFKDIELNRFHYMFIHATMNKLQKLFDYAKKATWDRVKEVEISLPVNDSGEIDFDFMEAYIKMTMMKSLQNVRDEAQRKIQKYEQIVSNF